MERRAASHTEEEEMNQRRKLLNAARRGDTKAISKLFELYQVRVLSGDQLAKVNRTSTYMAPVKQQSSKKAKASEKVKAIQPKDGKKSTKPSAAVFKGKSSSKKDNKPSQSAKRKTKR